MNARKENRTLPYALIVKGIAVGCFAGLTAVVYRKLLSVAETVVFEAAAALRENVFLILVLIPAALLIGFLISLLLRFEPMISGSGIPQIEGEANGRIDQKWRRVLPAKLAAGVLASLGGLSLGREGPSIQLGGMCGKGVAEVLHRKEDERTLMICGAGAGLSAAFNAPFAGVLFCLEEIQKNFSAPLFLTVMIASLCGDLVSSMVFGFSPSFDFELAHTLSLPSYGWIIGLGILSGAAAAFYNFVTLKAQIWYSKLPFLKPHQYVYVPLLLSVAVMFFVPEVLGSGHVMTQALEYMPGALRTILVLLTVKFVFSILCFGSGAAGGIFFPMLVLGSYLGAAYGNVYAQLSGAPLIEINNFIILGMAALFAGIVRAPLTGIVLIMEMTGGMPHLLSLTLVSVTAYLTAELLGAKPIYESLLERLLEKQKKQ